MVDGILAPIQWTAIGAAFVLLVMDKESAGALCGSAGILLLAIRHIVRQDVYLSRPWASIGWYPRQQYPVLFVVALFGHFLTSLFMLFVGMKLVRG